MSLQDKVEARLNTPTGKEPDGEYRARTSFDGTTGFIQTAGMATPPDHIALLEQFGYDPREVRIVGVVNQSRWQTYDERWLTAYKFAIAPAATAGIQEIIDLVGKKRPRKPQEPAGDAVYHWLAGDLQLGKIDGDGTEGIVTRYLASLDAGVAEFKRLRRTRAIGLVHLAWVGDCGEGNQSQNGRNMWRTSLTITEQYRLFRRLQLETINAFLPLAERIEGDTVNGNHDEVQRFQNTRPDDGHATEATIALADALTLNPASYGHVSLYVPSKDESTLTRDVGGTMMTHAHGHQWRKGQQFQWWSEQALNLHSPGAASFLIHGHTHEFEMKSKRDRTYICVPTFESESTYWRQTHGDVARPGAVSVVTRGVDWSDASIV